MKALYFFHQASEFTSDTGPLEVKILNLMFPWAIQVAWVWAPDILERQLTEE